VAGTCPVYASRRDLLSKVAERRGRQLRRVRASFTYSRGTMRPGSHAHGTPASDAVHGGPERECRCPRLYRVPRCHAAAAHIRLPRRRVRCQVQRVEQRFEELVVEAESVSVEGWDFSWLIGRATEERPSWGYSRMVGEKLAHVRTALDIQTGGGEVLAGVPRPPHLMVATESWPPNLARAAGRLRPRGVPVVADDDGPRLPFADAVFDLVLRPGGTYFSQQVGPGSVRELTEVFLGPQSLGSARAPERAKAAAEAAGLTVEDLRQESLRTVFHDVGAVIYFLRKVVWIVPEFTVDRYRPQLEALHHRIQSSGPFVAHATRFLIEARKEPVGLTSE
jgi:hypothetical protein